MCVVQKLDYQGFFDEIINMLRKQMDKDCLIEKHKVVKNNGIVLEGILIQKKGKNLIPAIYLESFYKEYQLDVPLSDIVLNIIDVYNKSLVQNKSLDKISFDYEDIRDKVVVKLINYSKNIKLLETVPHEKIMDLAVVYCCVLEQGGDKIKSITIKNEHLIQWNLDYKSFKMNALKNTGKLYQPVIKDMAAVLNEAKIDVKGGLIVHSMYILTNSQGINGASCMMCKDVLKQFGFEISKDFFILPSSIHELILLPMDKGLVHCELKNMVKEINESHVVDKDVLSNNVYIYSQIEKDIDKLWNDCYTPSP